MQQEQSKDFLKMSQDQHLKKCLDEDENVILSASVKKFNDFKKEQTRILIITNKNIFNAIPPNMFTNMMANVIGDNQKIKRKIPLSKITSITLSKSGHQFLIHVPEEYDYLFQSENQKEIIIQCLVEQYCLENKKDSLPIFFKDDQKLFNYLTTKEDKKYGISKIPKGFPLYVKPSDYIQVQNQQKNLKIEDFKILKVIGKGTFGKVMLAEKIDNGELLAIKSIRKQNVIEQNNVKHIKAERKILETMAHPFLVDLRYAFKSEDKLFFAMPFIKGGDFYQLLKLQGCLSEKRAKFYMCELVLAIQFIHSKDIIYRDLKPENILIDENGHICLADFGLAKYISNESQHSMTFAGTPMYIAPEMIESQIYGREIDWWGLGIILYEVLFGVMPFFNENSNFLFSMILNQQIKFPKQPEVSLEAQSLIQCLLQKDPKDRIGNYIINQKNQKNFYGADEIMRHPFFKDVDWERVIKKQEIPDWKPTLKNEKDCGNFDEEFTQLCKLHQFLEPVNSIVITKNKQKGKINEETFLDFDFKHDIN